MSNANPVNVQRSPVIRYPWSENPAPICDPCGTYGLIVPAVIQYDCGFAGHDQPGRWSWYCGECDPYDDEISPRAGYSAEKKNLEQITRGKDG